MKSNYKHINIKSKIVSIIFTILLVLATASFTCSYFKYMGYNILPVYTDHIMVEDDEVHRMMTATSTMSGSERRSLYWIVKSFVKELL